MATAAHPKLDLISSEHLVGAKIFEPSGKEIGAIDRLMIDKSTGRARYAVVDFCGFMCLRPGHHAVPWNALRYDKTSDRFMTEVTQELLEAAPEYDDASWTDREWETRIHRHYSARPYWEESASLGG